jgi:glycosyltransferase involved in cell wall biosynthesis
VRILQVIPSFPPTSAYTGPPASVHRLCQELMTLGVDVRVATTDDDGNARLRVTRDRWVKHDGVDVFYAARVGSRGDIAPALHRCIAVEAGWADLVHVAPVFSWPTLSTFRACQRAKRPWVISPRGSLASDALAWKSWKKTAFMALGGRRALRNASAFHATSAAESDDIVRLFPGAPVRVVPNGVNVPPPHEVERWKAGRTDRSVLYLGRLHRHKNVDLLISAWARVARRFPECRLVLAGPGSDVMIESLRRLCAELALGERVQFLGTVHGEENARMLSQAAALVLPSRSENFGNSVAEALAHCTPAIASWGTPWQGLETHGCGWWVEADVEALAGAIEEALNLEPETLRRMGRVGHDWMLQEFAWPSIASRMRDVYAELISRSRDDL